VYDKQIKEGRYLIAHAHGETMESASPSLIGSSWASADGFRRSLMRMLSCFAASCHIPLEMALIQASVGHRAEPRQLYSRSNPR
jgi:hypothetical protein